MSRRSTVKFWLYQTRDRNDHIHECWRYRFWGADGKMKSGTGCPDKGETGRIAQGLAIEADEIRRGARPAPHPADTESLKPIGDHITEYLDGGIFQGGRGGRPWSAVHAAKQRVILEKWMVTTLGWKTLRDVNLAELEKALREKTKRPQERLKHLKKVGVGGKTLHDYATSIRAFVRWSLKRKYLVMDPLDGLRRFDISPKLRRRALTLEEVGALLAVAPPDRRLIYLLALVTEFRAAELASLRVGDLDLVKGTLFLRADFAKDRQNVERQLPPDLLADLAPLCAGRGNGEALLQGFRRPHAAKWLYRDLKAAGIAQSNFHGKVDFHALRGTAITLGMHLGVDPKTSQDMARHKTPDLTMCLYAKSDPERLRQAGATLAGAFYGAEKGARAARIVQTPIKRAV